MATLVKKKWEDFLKFYPLYLGWPEDGVKILEICGSVIFGWPLRSIEYSQAYYLYLAFNTVFKWKIYSFSQLSHWPKRNGRLRYGCTAKWYCVWSFWHSISIQVIFFCWEWILFTLPWYLYISFSLVLGQNHLNVPLKYKPKTGLRKWFNEKRKILIHDFHLVFKAFNILKLWST